MELLGVPASGKRMIRVGQNLAASRGVRSYERFDFLKKTRQSGRWAARSLTGGDFDRRRYAREGRPELYRPAGIFLTRVMSKAPRSLATVGEQCPLR
jgi:hypothetical protein